MIILADPEPRFQSRVYELVGNQGELVVVDGKIQLEKVLTENAGRVDVVIVGPGVDLDEAFESSEHIRRVAPGISTLLVVSAVTSDVFQRALRAGVRDVLPATFSPAQLTEAIERAQVLSTELRGAVAQTAEAAPDLSGHKVITVFSSKGGCGKSFVASNLAVALAQYTGEKVAMVDLDLQFGDLAIMLQLFPARTIFDAAQSLDRLDADAMTGYLTPHRSNVSLLAAPLEPGLSETIPPEGVGRIVRLLKERYTYTVIDCPPSFTDHVLAALDESDECVLMTSMDVPSIKNAKLSLQTLGLLGFGRDRIRLVLNRADSRVGLTVQAIEKTLGTNVDVSIPSSHDVAVSINRGTPLVLDNPRSPVVSSIVRMLEFVGVDPEALRGVDDEEGGSSGGRFGRFIKRPGRK